LQRRECNRYGQAIDPDHNVRGADDHYARGATPGPLRANGLHVDGIPTQPLPVNSILVEERAIAELDLVGGDPALDFVNTLGGLREGPWDDEWLLDYRHLAVWLSHARLLPDQAVTRLLDRARAEPAESRRAHADALTMREAMYRVFAAQANRAQPATEDLAVLADAYREALVSARLDGGHQGVDWIWEAYDPRRALWLPAHAGIELLRSTRVARLSQCHNCRWLFLDASKNHSRRWCSMAHCGSDAKVHAARARRHA
jgi:predicted RNA-binding Zn ribbon-like protein